MQGSIRKKGATWSYRVEFGAAGGKRNQIERSGYKTKKEAAKALNDCDTHLRQTYYQTVQI